MNQIAFQKQVIREEYGLKSENTNKKEKQVDDLMRRLLTHKSQIRNIRNM